MPGLLYRSLVPGTSSTGAASLARVNGSSGGGRRFQKSPFQPVRRSWGSPSASASSIPEVWVARWRTVIAFRSGSSRHRGTWRWAGSSGLIRPSPIATIRARPPTRALASEAVPWGLCRSKPGAYRSNTIRSWRTTSRAVVWRPFRAAQADSSPAGFIPRLSGDAVAHSQELLGGGSSALTAAVVKGQRQAAHVTRCPRPKLVIGPPLSDSPHRTCRDSTARRTAADTGPRPRRLPGHPAPTPWP